MACETETKPIEFQTVSIENTYNADISVNIDKATGNSALSEQINSNIEKCIVTSLSDSLNNESLETLLISFDKDYTEFKNDFPESAEPVWELHIETEATYQSESVISIAVSTYDFQGGAHGNDKITFVNLDAKTGKQLAFSDLIEDSEEFKNLAQTHFVKSLKDEDGGSSMEDFFFGKSFQLPENIGFSDDGLVMLYNIYEIASYAQGYTEFVIPFEEAKSFLKLY